MSMMLPTPAVCEVIATGDDSTGATDSTAAWAASMARLVAMMQGNGVSTGVLRLRPGVFTGQLPAITTPGISIIGTGKYSTYIFHPAWLTNAACLDISDPNFHNEARTTDGAWYGGFTIDGTAATAGCSGIHFGELGGTRFYDVQVTNYPTGAIGWWLDNRYGWTEECNFEHCSSIMNGTQVVIDIASGQNYTPYPTNPNGPSNSWEYNSFDFQLNCKAGQEGLVVRNGAFANNCRVFLRGNAQAGSANSTATYIIHIEGSSNSQPTQLAGHIVVMMETDGAGTTHHTIKLDPLTGSANLWVLSGCLQFSNLGNPFQGSSGTSFSSSFICNGFRNIDGSLVGDSAFDVHGSWTEYSTTLSTASNIAVNAANLLKFVLASGANTLTLTGMTGAGGGSQRGQRLRFHLVQPSSGAAGTITFAGATVKTPNGSATLTLSSTNNDEDVVELWTLDGTTYYAAVLGLNFH